MSSARGVGLLLIDVINDFEFKNGETMFEHALPAAHNIHRLIKRVKHADLPVLYVNDNFGKWQNDFQATIAHCLSPSVRGQAIVRLLQPTDDDYFVLKPKHSAFYSTTLELLLKQLEVDTLLMCGFSTDICLLLSAGDAYMREYKLFIPPDCTASASPEDHQYAVDYMARVFKADTRMSTQLEFLDT